MHEGAMVVIHDSLEGGDRRSARSTASADGLEVTEARVVRIDRGQKRITVRFGNGQTESFQLTDRTAAEIPAELERAQGAASVVIYDKDEKSRKVAHFFKKTT